MTNHDLTTVTQYRVAYLQDDGSWRQCVVGGTGHGGLKLCENYIKAVQDMYSTDSDRYRVEIQTVTHSATPWVAA